MRPEVRPGRLDLFGFARITGDFGSLSLFHLGVLESVSLLVIAGIEAIVVLLFFMRVQASSKLIWLFAGGGFLWLGILLVFVITDYISRSWWR
jgi:cytochrome c oxidase subunit IV